jgi:Ran GTPase-activating protein (RanGAP) involved in mRNA processing and transport
MGNNSISSLNLSKNLISDTSCEIISEVIYRKINIREIYLHWNRITTKGGEFIFN